MPGRESSVSVLISCEHASKAVPPEWQAVFAGCEALLESHRGWDPGALELGHALSVALEAPLLAGRATRLLIDLNRSASHPMRFSGMTRSLPMAERQCIEDDYWKPHWRAYSEFLAASPGPVVHLACHSFAPQLDGVVRHADIGLLYDPCRASERAFADELHVAIGHCLPALRVRMNYPYRGTANGIGQQHRRCHSARRLISLELEINQALVAVPDWPHTIEGLTQAVKEVMGRVCGDAQGWPFALHSV